MAYTSEIEKLEARYRENPKGRNFAPLADAYRKAGLIDNAIELCQAGLQLHPDYVSGHIVHGRCLVDKKDDTGAEAVFRKVLELDPENILALKVLAEIAERNARFDEAVEWLNRLLLADPMNGEAAEGLSRVRGKAAAQPAPPPPAEEPVATMLVPPDAEAPVLVEHEELELQSPASSPGMEATAPQPRLSIEYMEGPFDAGMAEAATASMDRPEFDLERASEPPPDSSVSVPQVDTYEGLDLNQAAPEEVIADGLELEEPPALTPDAAVEVEGLARTQYEGSGMFKVDDQDERPTSPVADLPLIMPEDLEAEPWGSVRPSRETEPLEAPVAQSAPAAPAPPLHLPDDDGAADTATLSQAEPVVTETMAELYLRQGHREDALHVYEALLAQRPQDARLRQKVMELSAPPVRGRPSGSGQSAGAFLKGILSAKPGAPPPVIASEAPPASPPAPVRLSAPEGEAEAAEPAPGSPTRPASDAISLDSVFGEEGGRGSVPALPEPTPPEPAKLPSASGGFSFDDFFGTATAPASGGGRPAANARPPRPSGGGRSRSPEQEEDLDQFQAWLKSLKA